MISNDELIELYTELAEVEIKLYKWYKKEMPTDMMERFEKMMGELSDVQLEIRIKMKE